MFFYCKERQHCLHGVPEKIFMSESIWHTISSQYLEPSCVFQTHGTPALLPLPHILFLGEAGTVRIYRESWCSWSGVANITIFTCQAHQPPTLPALLAPAWGCRSRPIFQKTFSKRTCMPQSYGDTTNPHQSTVVSLLR